MRVTGVSGIDQFGTFVPKRLDHIIQDLKIYMRLSHGPDLGLAPGDPDLNLVHGFAPEIRTAWTGMHASYLQSFITTAEGEALDQLCALLQIYRRQALKAIGSVTFSRQSAAPLGGINVPIGTIVATVSGIRFSTTAASSIPEASTSVSVGIEANEAGGDGTVGANTIQTLITTVSGVDSVNNPTATSGGRDREEDDELRARALGNPSLRGVATPNAIQSRLAAVALEAYVANNPLPNATSDKTVLAAGSGATNSQEIRTANSEAISRKFVVPSPGKWIQDFTLKVVHGGTAPTVTISIVGDSSGLPNDTLVSSECQLVGLAPANGTTSAVHMAVPHFYPAGTYHVKAKPTVGSFFLKGTAHVAGTDTGFHNGTSWALNTVIDLGAIGVLAGIGPHGIEAFVEGGTEDDIAAALLKALGGGTTTTGDIAKDPLDQSGNPQRVYFSRPTTQLIYADVSVKVTSDWDAVNGPNAIRDALVRYIGGTDSKGAVYTGLAMGEDVIWTAAIAAIQAITGVASVPVLKLDTVDPPVATTDVAIAPAVIQKMEPVAGIGVTTV